MNAPEATTLLADPAGGAPCGPCPLRAMCTRQCEDEAIGAPGGELQRVQRKLRRGDALYRMGDPFRSVHVVQSGAFKTVFSGAAGEEVVTGFHLAGDAIGLDGISFQEHACSAFALEESRVCSVPYTRLESLCRTRAEFGSMIGRLIVGYSASHRRAIAAMRGQNADQRLAGFLLDLSGRAAAFGASATEFGLPMKRRDISRNVGITLESVSRGITKLRVQGVANVRRDSVKIMDIGRLRAMVPGYTPPG